MQYLQSDSSATCCSVDAIGQGRIDSFYRGSHVHGRLLLDLEADDAAKPSKAPSVATVFRRRPARLDLCHLSHGKTGGRTPTNPDGNHSLWPHLSRKVLGGVVTSIHVLSNVQSPCAFQVLRIGNKKWSPTADSRLGRLRSLVVQVFSGS